jgi:uncharacterized membrane protein (UPF0127 family)
MKTLHLLFLVLILLASCSSQISRVCFRETCFDVEIADSDEERSKGLMFRDSLGINNGMLFVFDKEDIYDFWMKNTKIPLDIIWLNKEKEVVYTHKNTPPCPENVCFSIVPSKKALYVLELNSGVIEKIDLSINDKLEFK